MDYLFRGPPEVVLATWVAIATIVLSLGMLLAIVGLRLRAQHIARRDAAAHAHWTGVFHAALDGQAPPVERLAAHEVHGFVDAWNEVHEGLAEPLSRRLVPLGKKAGLEQAAGGMLRGGYHDRARALVALGYMRDRHLFDGVFPYLDESSPIVSLCAARALAQMDPPRAMAAFVPKIVDREDWVPANVARILGENTDGSAARELTRVMPLVGTDMGVKLVRFLADINPSRAAGIIRELLHSDVDDKVRSACLRIVSDPQDLPRLRELLASPRWHVRMHAAVAIARIGDDGEAVHLEPLLSDAVWWVRYRTAQALLRLPDVGAEGLRALQQRQSDRYARDIIDQVLAEQELKEAA